MFGSAFGILLEVEKVTRFTGLIPVATAFVVDVTVIAPKLVPPKLIVLVVFKKMFP